MLLWRARSVPSASSRFPTSGRRKSGRGSSPRLRHSPRRRSQSESAAAIEKVKVESIAQQTAARSAGIKFAEAAAQDKFAEAERQKKEALERAENFETNLEAAIDQVREAKDTEMNAIKAQHFKETQKLTGIVEGLQRRLEQKNAQELGEGAEVDLFKALKAEFPEDLIARVPKGAAGADIIHVVKHNGKECGKIVYDSKNRKRWEYEYATKLLDDQIAEKAEHAILSTLKFPAGAQQVAVHAGVIIANPARVVTLAWILRREIIQTSSLRIVGNERDGKTAAL
jgi:hypothetical protein